MHLHEVLPFLLLGKQIRRQETPDLHIAIANTSLVMYTPKSNAVEPTRTAFNHEDVVATDWEVVL